MTERSVTWTDETGEWKYTVMWELAQGGVSITLIADDYSGGIGEVSMTDLDVDKVVEQLQQARDAGRKAIEGAP